MVMMIILHQINCFPFKDSDEDSCDYDDIDWSEVRSEAFNKLGEIREIIKNHNNKSDHDHHVVVKRDDGYGHDDDNIVVRCKHGYTGLFSFLAIPLLMGNVMINIMSMINVNVMIMATATGTGTGTGGGNNNNNNNNNNGGTGTGTATGTGNNNNNNNNNGGTGTGGGNNNNNNNGRSLEEELTDSTFLINERRRVRRRVDESVLGSSTQSLISDSLSSESLLQLEYLTTSLQHHHQLNTLLEYNSLFSTKLFEEIEKSFEIIQDECDEKDKENSFCHIVKMI